MTSNRPNCAVLLLTLLTGAMLATSGTAVSATCSFEPEPAWKIEGLSDVLNEKQRMNLSGLACDAPPEAGAARNCVLIQDEKFTYAIGRLSGRTITINAEGKLPKLTGGGEFDAEAVAFDGDTGTFIVLGSHSRKGKTCEANPNSRQIARLKLAPDGTVAEQAIMVGSLEAAILADRFISPFYGKCLGTKRPGNAEGDWIAEQGFNAEGAAISGGKLYAGLRGPVLMEDGKVDGENRLAAVLPVSLSSFEHAGPMADDGKRLPMLLNLGGNDGIRDLAAYSGGLLVLSGPQDDDIGAPAIYSWKVDGGEAVKLCDIPTGSLKSKPESLTVLEDGAASGGGLRLLVITDGVDGGAPFEVMVSP